MTTGLLLILLAALFQGTFLMPMSMIRKWAWEHSWAVFCLLGMVVFNWAIAVALLPNPLAIYASVPAAELWTEVGFGLGWGVGAVLFGLGMERLGLALGYPVIMGVNAAVGALAPTLWFKQESLRSERGLVALAGVAIAIGGIVVCSLASARKGAAGGRTTGPTGLVSGLVIGVGAGCLSSLPNIGLVYGTSTIEAARSLGASEHLAGNAVWAIFLAVGALVNVAYCGFRMARDGSFGVLFAPGAFRNLAWSAVMAAMWIGSLYLYGLGASKIGTWGPIVGWPLLTSVSIGSGILWGFWRGEWRAAASPARRMLVYGLLLIVAALCVLGFGNGLAQVGNVTGGDRI